MIKKSKNYQILLDLFKTIKKDSLSIKNARIVSH